MAERGELGARKSAVLRAVVEEYVRSGEPIGSETIADRYDLGVSSATIRNDLAALEEMGYLTHPHTSAGRTPTDLGYRHFVDALPARGKLRDTQRRAITDYFQQAVGDLEEVLRGAAQLLSRLTQYAGLAVPPSGLEERILRVELVSLGLRTTRGLAVDDIDLAKVQPFLEVGLVIRSNGHLVITERGMLLANEVALALA